MKALTIRQPWASLIAAGVKTIETRSWSTKYRGPLAIHAGKHPVQTNTVGYRWEGNYPLGAVVATCTLAAVVPADRIEWCDEPDFDRVSSWVRVNAPGISVSVRRAQLPFGDFTPGRYAWLLTDITPCDPVPAKGRQGLWDWDSGELDRG